MCPSLASPTTRSTKDATGQPLKGGTHYVLHFPADKLPSSVVDAYWSCPRTSSNGNGRPQP